MRKKVLVTGATGFVGDYVVKELLSKDYRVIATSASAEKTKSFDWYSQAEYIPLDLKDVRQEDNYFSFFGQPDILIHLAWEGLPNYKESFHLDDNLPRHRSFLKNMVENGLKDITVAGTCLEYGKQEGMLSEDMQVKPSTPYAVAKNELQLWLTSLTKDYPYILKWIRLFYMYGKGQGQNSLLSQLDNALANGEKVFNMSGGEQMRDYLPIEKVAGYIVSIALQDKVTGIINCCSGKPIRIKDFVTDYLKSRNRTIALNLGYYPYADYEPMNFWGDTRKLTGILNQS